jgi:hypothetical protein
MPFNVKRLLHNVALHTNGPASDDLARVCDDYDKATTPMQKARSVYEIMEVLEREVDKETCHAIMESCGRTCIGASTLKKARQFCEGTLDIKTLLIRLNENHIGGGYLRWRDNVIYAAYDRCYCGSVSKTKIPLSDAYCHCSCGWYKQLFETLLETPVEVELLGSIVQGEPRCEFAIRIGNIG